MDADTIPAPKPTLLALSASELQARVVEFGGRAFHAKIVRENGRYQVVDLGSANGVRVNAAELRRGIIEAGDVIELGSQDRTVRISVQVKEDADDARVLGHDEMMHAGVLHQFIRPRRHHRPGHGTHVLSHSFEDAHDALPFRLKHCSPACRAGVLRASVTA